MEALHSCLTTGEQSGGQDYCQPVSPHQDSQPTYPLQHQQQTGCQKPQSHGTLQQPKQSRKQHLECKHLKHQWKTTDSDTVPDHKHKEKGTTEAATISTSSPGHPSSPADEPTTSKPETQERPSKQKRERKPQRPGKYVCTYCGRACAKPSVLQKHIRSHTGERPYPCAPCGFSFKTKSNLYKHRKSHTHKVKAGLALGKPKSFEEQVTESEDETRQTSASSNTDTNVASVTSYETNTAKDAPGGNKDSYAVKKRLALRLSRGKHGPQNSSDEKTSSLNLGSKDSTESGYFSRSESTEQPQDSPPNTSAKSYAEIILGKYGRLGHLQRMSHHLNQPPSADEDKSIPFTVPKKQVIDHITKLITINEAVVDTSEIDSVKPRRFSLSRKNSSEFQKNLLTKEVHIHSPKAGDISYKNSGSITMGVPCEKFQHQFSNVEQPSGLSSSAPLSRSHLMPSAASSNEASSIDPSKFPAHQSFDEQASESRERESCRHRILRRQTAIEIPLGAKLTKEEDEDSPSFCPDNKTIVPDLKQNRPHLQEFEDTKCKNRGNFKKHEQSQCSAHHLQSDVVISQMECSQLVTIRAGASAMRKRRKEASFELDDPSSPTLASPEFLSEHCKDEISTAHEDTRRPTLQTCSVIQHTSSFEKQETLCIENQCLEEHEESKLLQKQPNPQLSKQVLRKLVRQQNVQVPEILVTEDSNMSTEKADDFQWPQRSPSLSQLPIEKLPPKKKRLRLAEVAQSSGDSSFDSVSLPCSPSQESTASYGSSRSASLEESNRGDRDAVALTPLRRSRAPHMLTVPGVNQHREMRRSASEQAPHNPQPGVLITETRSKSFDYSCLSPERSAIGWRERRKCLLIRHTAVRDPDEEEEEQCTMPSHSPERGSRGTSSQASPAAVYCSRSPTSLSSGETVLHTPLRPPCKEISSEWKLSESVQLTGKTEPAISHGLFVDPAEEKTLQINTRQTSPAQSHPTHGPSGAARAHYLHMSTGLKLEIPLYHEGHSEVRESPSHTQQSETHSSSSLELLRTVAFPKVAVRLQADTHTSACAIYTTLSQSTSPKTHNASVSIADDLNRRDNPDIQSWPEHGLRFSGSGGNKRMLSPSNSIELQPELQQQQKRVKEEAESEKECEGQSLVNPYRQDVKHENQSCVSSVCCAITHNGPSFPTLMSSTYNSWCYLNYTKPNPSALDGQKTSVYSSWSTGSYDPNPPGLSSKMALSLLHCKQRLTPSIYTLCPLSVQTTASTQREDNTRTLATEVYNLQSDCRETVGEMKGQQALDDNRSDNKVEEEDMPSCSRNICLPAAWTSVTGANEKTEDWRCNKASESLPSNSIDSSDALKPKGSLTEPLRYEAPQSEPGLSDNKLEVILEVYPDEQSTGQNTSPKKDSANVAKDCRQGEEGCSKTSETCCTASSESEKLYARGQNTDPQPRRSPTLHPDIPKRSLASTRRALFARRCLEDSASSVGLSQDLPSLEKTSPPHCRSPRPPSSSLVLRSRQISTPPPKPASPVKSLSPVVVETHGQKLSWPTVSAAATQPAPIPAHLSPPNQISPARLSEAGLSAHPIRPREASNVLSHLPLHSQQASRASSLLIPIGGIHMIQPRSPLPLYSLVRQPAAASANTGTYWRHCNVPRSSFSSSLRDVSSSRALDPSRSKQTPSEAKGSFCL